MIGLSSQRVGHAGHAQARVDSLEMRASNSRVSVQQLRLVKGAGGGAGSVGEPQGNSRDHPEVTACLQTPTEGSLSPPDGQQSLVQDCPQFDGRGR